MVNGAFRFALKRTDDSEAGIFGAVCGDEKD
jgi:hypothetical protein